MRRTLEADAALRGFAGESLLRAAWDWADDELEDDDPDVVRTAGDIERRISLFNVTWHVEQGTGDAFYSDDGIFARHYIVVGVTQAADGSIVPTEAFFE